MKKVLLIIRDGWGYRKSCKDNAICEGTTPFTDKIMNSYPTSLLDASDKAVGLPKGYQGNSEVGHMTIGSGRIIFQSMERINQSIKQKEFFSNKAFLGAINNCKKNKTKLHVLGLLQSEGVHSHINHLFAILDLCKKEKFKNVLIHIITDGRDSPVHNSLKNLNKLNKKIKKIGFGEITTISGRYYAMDRDKRWDRTKKAYDCIVKGIGESFTDSKKAIKNKHNNKETDEFILPIKKENYNGIKTNDSIIFFNFRTDRTRQLTKAIIENEFNGWKRKPMNVFFVAMTQFYNPINAKVAFPDIKIKNLLGEILSKKGIKQLRISETEKYAHVTFFFNGQIEKPFKGEDRFLIQSPKVATYDLQPEMSAPKIANKLVKEIKTKKYQFIVTNIVNGDMVGHTGIKKACLKATKSVDDALKKITEEAIKQDYNILIFADHGNLEDQSEKWRTSHTLNKVPIIYISKDLKKIKKGGLKDISPTVLDIFGIKQPKEMTGKSLLK